MTEELPDPPVPEDADLRHFDRMDLDVRKLLDSSFMALSTGDEFKAGVRLWCKAWHEVPAGSVPGDERLLATMAGFEGRPKQWAHVRERALQGFVKCSDGRWYHPEIVAVVMSVLEKSRKGRTAADARWKGKPKSVSGGKQKKPAPKPESASNASAYADAMPQTPTLDSDLEKSPPQSPKGDVGVEVKVETPRDLFASKAVALIEQAKDPLPAAEPGKPTPVAGPTNKVLEQVMRDSFEEFWRAYPKPANPDKAAAWKAYPRAVKTAQAKDILAGAIQYAAQRLGEEPRYTKHAATWLNQRCWENYTRPDPNPGEERPVIGPTAGAEGIQVYFSTTVPSVDVAGAVKAAKAEQTARAAGRPVPHPSDPLYPLFLDYPHLDLEDPNAWLMTYYRTKFWPDHLGPAPDDPGCRARPTAIAAARNAI